jgi:hypothetical protein
VDEHVSKDAPGYAKKRSTSTSTPTPRTAGIFGRIFLVLTVNVAAVALATMADDVGLFRTSG